MIIHRLPAITVLNTGVKGRGKRKNRKLPGGHGTLAQGKLLISWEIVCAMRLDGKTMTMKQVALKYGICYSYTQRILNFEMRVWR